MAPLICLNAQNLHRLTCRCGSPPNVTGSTPCQKASSSTVSMAAQQQQQQWKQYEQRQASVTPSERPVVAWSCSTPLSSEGASLSWTGQGCRHSVAEPCDVGVCTHLPTTRYPLPHMHPSPPRMHSRKTMLWPPLPHLCRTLSPLLILMLQTSCHCHDASPSPGTTTQTRQLLLSALLALLTTNLQFDVLYVTASIPTCAPKIFMGSWCRPS